jgi:hypothetical protein
VVGLAEFVLPLLVVEPVFDVRLLVVVPLFVVERVFVMLLFIVPLPPLLLVFVELFVVEPVLVVPPDTVFIVLVLDIEFVFRIRLPFALLLSADEQLPLTRASDKSAANAKIVFIENFSCFFYKC